MDALSHDYRIAAVITYEEYQVSSIKYLLYPQGPACLIQYWPHEQHAAMHLSHLPTQHTVLHPHDPSRSSIDPCRTQIIFDEV